MKTIKRLSVVFALIFATVLSSCSGNDDDGSSGPASGAFVKAKIDGSGFSATGEFAIAVYHAGNLAITGTTTGGTTILLNLYDFDGTIDVGTYNINAVNTSDAYTGSAEVVTVSNMVPVSYSSVNCDNAEGTIEITASDATKIEGTFSFKAKEVKQDESCNGGTKNVTNGSFRAMLNNN